MRATHASILSLLLAGSPAGASDVAGTPSDLDREAFLLSASIRDMETLPVGCTEPAKAILDDGATAHPAHIQTVDVYRDPPFDYMRDSYKFNVAAYRLARLLGFDRVPVSVERTVGGESAAVTWWIDDVAMMEKERADAAIEPPDPADFDHQMQQVRIFSQLVHNTDLNPGNVLITEDWRVWVVDFTRAFRVGHELEREELGGRIDRSLYAAMRDLDREAVVAELSPYLTEPEIDVVMAGREQVVAYYDEQIAANGESAVLCDDVH
jgi:hypothetical protein